MLTCEDVRQISRKSQILKHVREGLLAPAKQSVMTSSTAQSAASSSGHSHKGQRKQMN